MRPTYQGARAFFLFVILVGASGCVRYVERTVCGAACCKATSCVLREGDRYSNSWPLVTAIAGMVALGAGGTMLWAGRAEHEELERDLEQTVTTQGTRPFSWDPDREDRAMFLQNAGSGLIGVGVVALAVAAVLYLHQKKPRPVLIRRIDP